MKAVLFFVACLALVSVVVALPTTPTNTTKPRPLGWGPLGHYMSAQIAYGRLTKAALNGCANLLPDVNGEIALIASWADDVARDLYPWSAELHYINTPDWDCTYNQKRDCIGEDSGDPLACVDGAIQNYTSILAAGTAGSEEMTDALMFLVHFIGDIHQPLHVGFKGDEGGNTEKGTFEGTDNRKLHQIWDTDMIEKRMNDDFEGDNTTYYEYYEQALASGGEFYGNISDWLVCSNPAEPNKACSIEWAQNSVQLACQYAYTDQDGNQIEDGFDLEDPYYDFALPIVEQQIAKGGVRMANVINSLFAQASMAKYTVDPEEYKRINNQPVVNKATIILEEY